MWLYLNFQPKIYPILRGPDYVIVTYGMKSITFWGDLTMWLYFPVKNLSHSEETWLCDHNFQPKIYPILRNTDYVIILSCQKSIPFWGNLTMWSQFLAKNLSHSKETWLCDHNFQLKIYPSLRGPDYVIILFSQKSIPFWGATDYVIILFSQKFIPFW